MNNQNQNGVLIIGGHVQGLGIARIFGKNNIPVALMDTTKFNLTRHSKFCSSFVLYNKGELLNKLRALIAENQYQNWLLMPTNDLHVGVLGTHKEELSKHFKVSTENSKVLDYFFNKRKTYKLAEDLNIAIPATWSLDSWDEIRQETISFPCIIKPAVMHTFYSKTKKKVFVCNDMAELEANYQKALTIIPKEEIIIQDIIPGTSEHQYSVCFMFDKEAPLVTLSARRARQHPPDFGNATTYAETVDIPEIVESAKKILSSIGFSGVCEVEFKFDDRDQKFKFLEVNPRTWKWHSIAEKSDSPILMSLYHKMYGLDPIVKNTQTTASFRHYITDIPTMLTMRYRVVSISI